MRIFIVCLALLVAISNARAAEQAACRDARQQAWSKIDDTYLPKIDLWIKVSKTLKDKGLDPVRYPVVIPENPPRVEVLNLTDVIRKLGVQRVAAYNQVETAIAACNNGLAPYQKALDLATFFATEGLSAVLPPQMTHIDASQILSGHPLGGPNALIPNMRDDLLNGLGVGGAVACAIRDPLRAVSGQC